MPLAALTSALAVRPAIDEFTREGREAFLAKYGFGKSREYFVRLDGRLYDSKAIAGVALGYQYPEQGPLTSRDFSGGEATVQAKLEELGFEVVRVHEVAVHATPTIKASQLEREFHARLLAVYQSAKEAGYNATRFLSMLSERGGLETARILLGAATVSDGYSALWELGRLDLTVEAVILEEPWRELFTPVERRTAIRRLQEYQFPGHLPTV